MATEMEPNFTTLVGLEDSALAAKLAAVRSTISHGGEKGRALEQAVVHLLRDFLPAEYGLSTGFIAYHEGAETRLSSQLDIIIYDALRTGPLARLGACDVFPIEAVYGYVEVKASIRSSTDAARVPADNSIERCLQQNQLLRQMVYRRFHVQVPGTMVESELQQRTWRAIRSFVVAFSADGSIASDANAFAQRMADASRALGHTHLHGVFIVGSGFFQTRPVNPATGQSNGMYTVDYVQEHGLSVFKAGVLHSLARFPRFPSDWTPAIDEYFVSPTWSSRSPSAVL